jgi:hypothetical protein
MEHTKKTGVLFTAAQHIAKKHLILISKKLPLAAPATAITHLVWRRQWMGSVPLVTARMQIMNILTSKRCRAAARFWRD